MPDSPTSKTNAVIPAEDLKPLYDFAIDCKACQTKLAAAQGDLTDERQKTIALTRERDDALHIARGDSAWRRISGVPPSGFSLAPPPEPSPLRPPIYMG